MNHNLKNVIFLNNADANIYTSFLNQTPSKPFSNDTIDYLIALSKELNNDSRIREYPDVATLSFYCRKANLFGFVANALIASTIILTCSKFPDGTFIILLLPDKSPIIIEKAKFIGTLEGAI